MLIIKLHPSDVYDDENNEFLYFNEQVIHLEHCLKAIRDWESKWEKPFFSKDRMTTEETVDYIYFMAKACGDDVDKRALYYIPEKQINEITDYINKKATATWFTKEKENRPLRNQQVVTSELIYYWMIEAQIPFECEYWHINQLTTLIQVCGHKAEEKNKKMEAKTKGKKGKAASKDSALRFAQLNRQRQAKYNTKG